MVKIERSTLGIRDFIFEEMEKLANGEIDIDRLKVMSKAGDTILKSAIVDMQATRMAQRASSMRFNPKKNLNLLLGSRIEEDSKMIE